MLAVAQLMLAVEVERDAGAEQHGAIRGPVASLANDVRPPTLDLDLLYDEMAYGT